jgi:hypothetical protein
MLLQYKYLVFTCIQDDISNVKSKISELISSGTKFPINWSITQTNLDYKEIYYPVPPSGGSHFPNFIIWEPLNNIGTTVFFVNYEDGWNSLMERYAKTYNKIVTQVRMSDEDINYPMFKFSYYEGLQQRVILCYKDYKKWEFFQKGEILSFEDESHYTKYRIKERLPNTLIIDYLKKAGWDISDSNFWNTNKPVYNFQRIQWDK